MPRKHNTHPGELTKASLRHGRTTFVFYADHRRTRHRNITKDLFGPCYLSFEPKTKTTELYTPYLLKLQNQNY